MKTPEITLLPLLLAIIVLIPDASAENSDAGDVASRSRFTIAGYTLSIPLGTDWEPTTEEGFILTLKHKSRRAVRIAFMVDGPSEPYVLEAAQELKREYIATSKSIGARFHSFSMGRQEFGGKERVYFQYIQETQQGAVGVARHFKIPLNKQKTLACIFSVAGTKIPDETLRSYLALCSGASITRR